MNFLASAVWTTLTRPAFIIAYIVIVVVLIAAVVVSVMLNELRLNAAAKRLKDTADELQNAEDGEQESLPRFSVLTAIDAEPVNAQNFCEDVTLKGFCEEFRTFAASKLGLYYDISVIREFVAGLAVSRIMILQGMSGTGKTSLAFAFGEFLDNSSTVIPVQPMWKERTDLLGYYNEFTKHFNETLLLEKMYEANRREDIYITVLDELNIARVEYYFAEFLSMLEIPDPDLRYLEVVSDRWKNDPVGLKNGRIKLPENMWFVGTANNDDSTFAISDKVYDRAMLLNLDRKTEPFPHSAGKKMPITAKKFMELATQAQKTYAPSKEYLAKLATLDEYLIQKFQITFGNRIMRQIQSYLPVYVSCGGKEIDALDDIVCKKLLRKLETQSNHYLKSEAEALCGYLDELFGKDAMTQCKAYVRRIAKNL